MFYIFGDLHGDLEIEKVTDFFEVEACIRELSEKDYAILLGDVGLCWDGEEKDEWVRNFLENLPVTVLWIDGNHENFDLIEELPISDWNGGKVQFIGSKIIHLMRGYVYNIEGKHFFTFGGGHSIDKAWRTEGISWWPQEMPSKDEYERGIKNLQKVENKVDYILTHTAPKSIARQLVNQVYPGEEELQDYFEKIAAKVIFHKWYFGHWHMDCSIGEFSVIYEDVVRL